MESETQTAQKPSKKHETAEAPVAESQKDKRPKAEAVKTERSAEDDLAPMPMPILDASDDTPVSNLYVPADIGRKMRAGEKVGRVHINPVTGQRKPASPDQRGREEMRA